MQAPLLAQPEKRDSLQRDRAIWADECIGCSLRGPISWCHTVPSAQIAQSRTGDLVSASLAAARYTECLIVVASPGILEPISRFRARVRPVPFE